MVVPFSSKMFMMTFILCCSPCFIVVISIGLEHRFLHFIASKSNTFEPNSLILLVVFGNGFAGEAVQSVPIITS